MADNNQTIWPVGKKAAFFTMAVVFLLGVFDFIDRQILASLLPYIRQEWHLTDIEVGSIMGIVNISIAILVVPCGYFIDRWSRKKMLALMGTIWGLASASCAFAGNISHLLAARFLVGAGEAGYNPAASALLAAQFPKKHLSKALGIVQLGMMLGIPVGLALGGWLGAHYGWRHAFGIVAIPGIIISLLALFIKDYHSVTPSSSEKSKNKTSYWKILGEFAHIPSFWLVVLASALNLMVSGAAQAWRPMYFVREAGLDPVHAANMAAIIQITIFFSMAFSGFCIDFMRKRFINGTAIIAIVALSLQAVFSMIVYSGHVAPGSNEQVAVFLLAGLFNGFTPTAAVTVIADLVHPGIRASALSLQVFAQNIFGMALGPVFIGWMSMQLGSLQTSLFVVSALNLLTALCYAIIAFVTYKRDLCKNSGGEVCF